MSDAYELLEAGSTVTGDTWTMLNNLGGGGTGQIIHDMDGVVMAIEELNGTVDTIELSGYIVSDDYIGSITINELVGTIESENVEGEV